MTAFDVSEYDGVILAGRAIRPEEYDPARWKIWSQGVKETLVVPPLYPGHTVTQCEACGIDIQVGPRQQEQVKALPAGTPVAYVCLVDVAHNVGSTDHVTLHNLGNPYEQED